MGTARPSVRFVSHIAFAQPGWLTANTLHCVTMTCELQS